MINRYNRDRVLNDFMSEEDFEERLRNFSFMHERIEELEHQLAKEKKGSIAGKNMQSTNQWLRELLDKAEEKVKDLNFEVGEHKRFMLEYEKEIESLKSKLTERNRIIEELFDVHPRKQPSEDEFVPPL